MPPPLLWQKGGRVYLSPVGWLRLLRAGWGKFPSAGRAGAPRREVLPHAGLRRGRMAGETRFRAPHSRLEVRQPVNRLFKELELALAARPDLTIWWRDDDIAYIHPWHPWLRVRARSRLKFVCDILARSSIPALLAVEPWQFLEKAAPLLNIIKATPMPLAIHGIRHKNRARHGKSEFPPEYAGEAQCREILALFRRFRREFGERLLPVFVPPFNSIAPPLVRLLRQSGLAVSGSNVSPGIAWNTDYDFVDWERRRLWSREKIVADLAQLCAAGSPFIGINSHHKLIAPRDRRFVRALLELLDAHARRTGNTRLPFGQAGP